MKSLIKYVYYPPLTKHFIKTLTVPVNEVNKKVEKLNEKVKEKVVIKNTDYCNIWIRKNF